MMEKSSEYLGCRHPFEEGCQGIERGDDGRCLPSGAGSRGVIEIVQNSNPKNQKFATSGYLLSTT